MGRFPFRVLFGLMLLTVSLSDVLASDGGDVGPSESECRPYIEKAINELKTGEHPEHEHDGDITSGEDVTNVQSDKDETDSVERQQDETDDKDDDGDDDDGDNDESTTKSTEETEAESTPSGEEDEAPKSGEEKPESSENKEDDDNENEDDKKSDEEKEGDNGDDDDDAKSEEESAKANEESSENKSQIADDDGGDSQETAKVSSEIPNDGADDDNNDNDGDDDDDGIKTDDIESSENQNESIERTKRSLDEGAAPSAEDGTDGDTNEEDDGKSSKEAAEEEADEADEADAKSSEGSKEADGDKESKEDVTTSSELKTDDRDDSTEGEVKKTDGLDGDDDDDDDDADNEKQEKSSKEADGEDAEGSDENKETDKDGSGDEVDSNEETKPEDELLWEGEIPEILRNRNHISELLRLDEEFDAREKAVDRVAEIILRDIKRVYENGIKPLEQLYKYRDLSNRHFGDPEIFSKPLVLFMGPWSGGKSSIINYLTGNEYTPSSLRTGAEPSPAYFNILMWGNETEVLDGTQLAADYTFAGLQKFGQGLEDRLRGLKLPSKLLEKVNIVEIPGILEVRKQVSRLFPFNDACQWFIDRADIIFLVYDPAKLDVGPETEAILDQLKGREYQTRIILNKADTVKPEELLRIQSALIWNISPIMSSAQPPLMYTTSLWSHPYESGAPVRLLQAQERAFLRDMREAVDKRIEHKISSARRFAVRVRNHVKMVDCYLNTFYNHKTLFGNKKRIADNIIEHPQNYHIYEGLSTLSNISRYDLPDPEVYRDFFRLNPLYEFRRLSETCTFFRGCPISKLDVAIAYDLPELAGKYKKMAEAALAKVERSELSKS